MKSLSHVVKHARFSPLEVALIIPITAFLYTLMEWIFVISKPSFINTSTLFEKLFVLINATALISIAAILALIPFIILYYCLRSKLVRTILRFLLCLVPAFIMAAAILLLVDNTTYTLLDFGVVSTKDTPRLLYLIGFILLTLALVLPAFRISHTLERSRRKSTLKQKPIFPMVLGLVLLLCAGLPMALNSRIKMNEPEDDAALMSTKLPNILLITGDGINAAKLSLYGSEKDTTPFLRELAETSLVADNAFSNAQGTIGSTTSILTGKDPSDIRVLAATDILKGDEAFEHLPGILNSYGYYTVQLSFSYYADAFRINIQGGFDEANGESLVQSKVQTALAEILPTDFYYFMREMYTRISDRLGHLFYAKEMTNPFIQVTESPEKFNDQEKLDYLFKLLDQTEQPVFVHLHWMGTHGPKYYPEQQVFSAGKDIQTQAKYEDDFYLDSILQFDDAISQIYTALEERELLDQSMLIVGSDHTQRWSIARIPLLIHFPDSVHAGHISANVQNMDIAPTILDYLDIPQPEWMAGQSLLTPLDPDRLIFLAAIPDSKKDPETGKITYPEAKAPFYQFGKMTMIVCDRYYQVNFLKMKLTNSKVAGYIGDCSAPAPDNTEALQMIIAHLQQYGFTADSLAEIEP